MKEIYLHNFLLNHVSDDEKKTYVSHINKNFFDNRLENLQILTQSEHQSLHQKIFTWSKKYAACRACGTTEKKHLSRGLCSTCYQRHKNKHLFL
jgi:Zn finger protein HypA/HybF involved in hydrogenase expression